MMPPLNDYRFESPALKFGSRKGSTVYAPSKTIPLPDGGVPGQTLDCATLLAPTLLNVIANSTPAGAFHRASQRPDPSG
jgi:hypothetical protein